jgi:hypothetical protein
MALVRGFACFVRARTSPAKSGTDLNEVIDALIDSEVAQPVIASANSNAK